MKLQQLCCYFCNLVYHNKNIIIDFFTYSNNKLILPILNYKQNYNTSNISNDCLSRLKNVYTSLIQDYFLKNNKQFSIPNIYSLNKNNQCFTTTNNNNMFIVFRGTYSVGDWIINSNITRKKMYLPYNYLLGDINYNEEYDIANSYLEPPQVHSGFLKQFNNIKVNLDKDINNFINNNISLELNYNFQNNYYKTNLDLHYQSRVYQNSNININLDLKNKNINLDLKNKNKLKLILTGHSLGGAIASIASLYYAIKYPMLDIHCYTFGSPRVGNDIFVSLFTKYIKNHIRFVNKNDPVPFVPLPLNFTHLPNSYYFNNNILLVDIINNNLSLIFKQYLLSNDVSQISMYSRIKTNHSSIEYLKQLETNNIIIYK